MIRSDQYANICVIWGSKRRVFVTAIMPLIRSKDKLILVGKYQSVETPIEVLLLQKWD
jgi:hypothetical protein